MVKCIKFCLWQRCEKNFAWMLSVPQERVMVTHIDGPLKFWVQSIEHPHAHDMQAITENLQVLCPSASTVVGALSSDKVGSFICRVHRHRETGPRTFADKRRVGPVKLLCNVYNHVNISKIRTKFLLGPVKAQCLGSYVSGKSPQEIIFLKVRERSGNFEAGSLYEPWLGQGGGIIGSSLWYRLVLPFDTKNPYRLSKLLYRSIIDIIDFLASYFSDRSRGIDRSGGR